MWMMLTSKTTMYDGVGHAKHHVCCTGLRRMMWKVMGGDQIVAQVERLDEVHMRKMGIIVAWLTCLYTIWAAISGLMPRDASWSMSRTS